VAWAAEAYGRMIGVPLGPLVADQPAEIAQFFLPFRVPIARLAAAQAAIGDAKEQDK
jgi:hypothetical protein